MVGGEENPISKIDTINAELMGFIVLLQSYFICCFFSIVIIFNNIFNTYYRFWVRNNVVVVKMIDI